MPAPMTNAIFYNHQRGSGREVTVNLIDAGVEIVSISGEPIAVWPYEVIDLIKYTSLADEGEFTVKHDQFNTLQAVEPATFKAIIQRAAQACRTLRGSGWTFERIYDGVPRNIQGVVAIAIFYGLYKAYHWLF